jgi:hypothetical protein
LFFFSRALAAFSFRVDRILISWARQSSVSVRAFPSVNPSSASRFSSMAEPMATSLFSLNSSFSSRTGLCPISVPGVVADGRVVQPPRMRRVLS